MAQISAKFPVCNGPDLLSSQIISTLLIQFLRADHAAELASTGEVIGATVLVVDLIVLFFLILEVL